MKRLIVLTLLIVLSSNSFGQASKTKLLLGMTDKYVRRYLDSIVSANKNNGVYLEESTKREGRISMGVYSENEEEILDCLAIYCFFKKVGNEQICIEQLIGGNPEYGEIQKAVLNSNYKKIGANKWTKPFKMGFLVLAEYVNDKSKDLYYITYKLVDDDSESL